MCILFIALGQHPDHPLVIAANRDEFHARPSRAMHWWPDRPGIFAGRDLTAGGTWLGVNRRGCFAAVTNFRTAAARQPGARSRGELVANFLAGDGDTGAYGDFLSRHHQEFSPFNLVFGDQDQLCTWGHHSPQLRPLAPGFHSVSNGPVDTVWPKMSRGVAELSRHVRVDSELDAEALLPIMLDRSPAPDDELPDTGLDREREKWLSPIYILGPEYGTRTTSILLFRRDAMIISEYDHGSDEPTLSGREHHLDIDSGAE